jgi:prepilin-type N-terminal cleavage/methylation domain-containing protein
MEPTPLKTYPKQTARGFTLVELLVVVAIVGIILTGVIVGQTNFNRTFVLTDTAYTLALSIRETQSLGLSTSQFNGSQNSAYGINIKGKTPTTIYTQFADIYPPAGTNLPVVYGIPAFNTICPGHTSLVPGDPEGRPGNCFYDQAGNEKVQQFTFSHGYTISSYCGYSGVTQFCSTSGVPIANTLDELDIVFQRPNVQTILVGFVGTGTGTLTALDSACITIKSPPSSVTTTRYIKVTQLGQILVDILPCP